MTSRLLSKYHLESKLIWIKKGMECKFYEIYESSLFKDTIEKLF